MRFLVFGILFFSLSSAFAQRSFCGKVENTSISTYKDFNYCVDYISDNIDFSKVIYFFHGIFGSEMTWFEEEKYQKIRNQFIKTGRPIPPVVTLSFGETWLVSRQLESNPNTGLYEQIKQQVFPFIENLVLRVSSPTRLGFGMSMGGFNMTQLHLHSPNLFEKLALTCPAMANESPHAELGDIKDYVQRNSARYTYVLKALQLSRKYFETPFDWEQDSPLEFLEKFQLHSTQTRFYISAVTNDEFGFTEGDLVLANRLHHQGFSVKWEFVQGSHCDINPISVANFLMTP
jgi:enterochelin esterase-like enzyme